MHDYRQTHKTQPNTSTHVNAQIQANALFTGLCTETSQQMLKQANVAWGIEVKSSRPEGSQKRLPEVGAWYW